MSYGERRCQISKTVDASSLDSRKKRVIQCLCVLNVKNFPARLFEIVLTALAGRR